MNSVDLVHGAVLGDVLYHSLEGEAKSHQASFDKSGFNKVIELAKTRKIRVHFAVVALRDSLPKFAGCTIDFPTVITEWTGKEFCHYPAVYAEDFCVSSEISAEFKKQTATQENPKGLGLGTYFEGERTKISAMNLYGDFPDGNTPAGLVVEHGIDNKTAICLLNKFGANIKEETENAVIQFNDVTSFSKHASLPVQIEELRFSAEKTECSARPYICCLLG